MIYTIFTKKISNLTRKWKDGIRYILAIQVFIPYFGRE